MRISDWSSDVCSSDLGQLSNDLLDFIEEDDKYTKTEKLEKIRGIFEKWVYPKTSPLVLDKTAYDLISSSAIRRFSESKTDPYNRSKERRVGKECVSTCSSRGSPNH